MLVNKKEKIKVDMMETNLLLNLKYHPI